MWLPFLIDISEEGAGQCRSLSGYGAMTGQCRISIRQTFKMPASDPGYHFFHSLMQRVSRASVPSHTGAGRHKGSVCLKRHIPDNLVIWSLRQTYNRLQRQAFILVARGLAAPRSTINDSFSICYAYHRIIIIQKFCVIYIFKPQAAVGTFSRTAPSKEHISPAIVLYHRSVYHQCIERSRTESI